MDTEKIFCPDIGDFEEVDVIEILVKEGQTVHLETPLITLESDKATMDIPSPLAGIIDRILVKIGDKVSKNDTVAMIFNDTSQDKQKEINPKIPDSLPEVKQSSDKVGVWNGSSYDRNNNYKTTCFDLGSCDFWKKIAIVIW